VPGPCTRCRPAPSPDIVPIFRILIDLSAPLSVPVSHTGRLDR
jgi:hypothetical protein